MEDAKLIRKYARLFAESLKDPVVFARDFLSFRAFPYQEEFLRDDSALIVACCGRQVGKTTLAAIKALHFALSNAGTRILVVSAGLRQSMILFDKILDLVELAPPVRVLLGYRSRTKVEFANGSEIVALPCGRDGSTLRDYTADMAILDEANFIPNIVIDSVIRPTTITRRDAKMIMMSTPWTKNHPFYEALSKQELGFKAYTWPTSMNPQVSAKRLELERRTIGEHDFNREYNALFMDEQFSYFPSSLVLSCTDDYELDPDPEAGRKYDGKYYVGLDFGKHTDHSAIAVLTKTPTGELRLVYLKQFQLNTSYSTVVGHLRRLDEAYGFAGGCLDQTGVGEAPYEAIKEFMERMRGITLTTTVKEDMLGRLRLTMENRELIIPRDQITLLTQITNQQCEPTAAGKLRFYHPTGTKDDLLWALALAVHATSRPTRALWATLEI